MGAVACRQPYRSTQTPAAPLTLVVGPLATHKQVPDSPGSETSSSIVRTSSGHFRAFPGIFGYEMIIAYRIVRRRIACDRACRVRYRPSPDRMPLGPSRREWPVAGHGVAKGRRVRDDPSPDRVPSGASRAVWPVARSRAVGSVAGSRAVWPVAGSRLVTSLPTPATARLCHHGQASRTPVVGHAPAQQRL